MRQPLLGIYWGYYAHKALKEADDLFERLKHWCVARPFLWPSRCPYARFLIGATMDAYERYLEYSSEDDSEGVLQMLNNLLIDPPPTLTPPATMWAVLFS